MKSITTTTETIEMEQSELVELLKQWAQDRHLTLTQRKLTVDQIKIDFNYKTLGIDNVEVVDGVKITINHK